MDENRATASCFKQLTSFQDRNSSLFGYNNELDVIIIPAQYETARSFTDDELACVRRPGEGYGYIRTDGSDLLVRNDLAAAADFYYGLAAVKQGRFYGYLDRRGVLAIRLK